MWRALVVVGGLFIGALAEADQPVDAGRPEEVPAHLGPFGAADPVESAKDKIEEKQSEEQLRQEERLARLRASQGAVSARIVVLQWQDSDVDYKSELLRRNIKSRIARPNGKFYPDVDLYQAGRKEPDPTLRPLDQRGVVPESTIEVVMAAVREQESRPWNAFDETEWGSRAYRLKELAKEIWFVDRPSLRTPLFLLYTQVGYAAENSNNPGPPFFEEVAGITVNYYWYLAAGMAHREPSLMQNLTNPEMYSNIDAIKQRLDRGDFLPMTLNFELAGSFNPEQFTLEYVPYFNGIPDQITNEEAIYDVPAGVMDVYLQRNDGHGMSVRLEAVKLTDQEVYGVRDQARKRMGLDFIKQLLKNPDQCIPDIDGDILNYLAIYQKLHPGAEIYIAIPYGGSTHKIYLWKWVPDQAVLIRINDNTGGFPVRFVALLGTGLTISGASVGVPADTLQPPQPDPNAPGVEDLLPNVGDFIKPKPEALPISYELRGHWGRLMVGFGMDFALNLSEGQWREVYQTHQKDHVVAQSGNSGQYDVITERILTEQVPKNGAGQGEMITVPVVKELDWQRGVFLSIGGVFGKDAAYGFGPRLVGRTGWYNAPHAVDLTGHAGWSIKPPLGKKDNTDRRVFPVIDTDLHAGVMLPFRDSIFLISNTRLDGVGNDEQIPATGGVGSVWVPMAAGEDGRGCLPEDGACKRRPVGKALPTFGFTLKVGLTF